MSEHALTRYEVRYDWGPIGVCNFEDCTLPAMFWFRRHSRPELYLVCEGHEDVGRRWAASPEVMRLLL